jgi:uncharacterized protein YifE (UPF0438 family)
MKKEPEYQELPCALNEEELSAKGQELARKVGEISRLEADLKSLSSGYKTEIKKLAVETTALVREIGERREYREVEVEEFKNYAEGIVIKRRLDTYEEIGHRRMRPDERQQKLAISEPELFDENESEHVEPATEESEPVDPTSPEPASDPEHGVCRVCGCTDDNPCYGADDESCTWAPGENHTLCTICRDKAASPEAAGGSSIAQSDDAPDGNTMEGGLRRALHTFADAASRWAALREKGATDKELREAVVYELGISGSSGGPGLKRIAYKGKGKEPAFWFDSRPPAKPTLKGKALIEKARAVMRVPQPTAKVDSSTAEIDDAEAEEMYRAYDRMRTQMAALQEKARNPRDEDESQYVAKMINETRYGLSETERDWAAFVSSNKERAEAIHRKVSNEHDAYDRKRTEEMVKDIKANKKLSFESLVRLGYEYELVTQAEAAGLIHRKTNLSNFEAGPMPPKKSKPKAEPASVPEPIVESSDDGEADPLDLVPDDRRNRTWRDLPEWELTQWQSRLISKRNVAGVIDPSRESEALAYLERIKAEIDRRSETRSKADAADAAGGD